MLELVRAQNSKLKPEKFRPVPAYFEVVNWISCLKTRLTRCEGCRSEELQKGREQEFPILEFRSASPASTDQEWHGCSCRRNRPLATLAWEINKSIEIDSFCLYTTSIQDLFFFVFFSTVSSRYVNYKKISRYLDSNQGLWFWKPPLRQLIHNQCGQMARLFHNIYSFTWEFAQ